MRFILATIGISFAASLVRAQEAMEYTPPANPQMPDPAALLTRLIFVTAIALAVCGIVLWLARRAQRAPAGKGDPTGRLQLEGTLAIDRRSAVHLLRIDGQATVAVTTDATGLRSLTLLNESFESTLTAAERTQQRPE